MSASTNPDRKLIIKPSERRGMTLAIIFIVLAAPASISAAWHYLTGTATPLAITREQQALDRIGDGVAILAMVAWGEDSNRNFSQADTRKLLQSAFSRHGEEVVIIFDQTSGSQTNVTYRIGANRIGPVPLSEAGTGVRMAIEAYRMHQ